MKYCLLLVFLILSSAHLWADTKEFVREYTYVAGEADSKISARQMAMQEVKRELLNEIGTHIYSRIDISENTKGETDAKQEIRAMTAGFVKVDVLEEKWDGYKFYIKARMAADPEEILNRIKDLASNDEEKIKLKEQLNQSAKAFEDLRLEMLALKKALEDSKSDNEKQELALVYVQKSKDMYAIEMYQKGLDYYWGRKGKRSDYQEAIKWYQKAADQGYAKAQYNLAFMYANGKGVQQDDKQALYWYQKAADQGGVNAQFNLGIMYNIGKGVQQDYRQAVYWFQKTADQGDAVAQLNLGIMYADGKGVQQDYKQAVYWFQKAADQSHALAQFNLGNMYDNGFGVQQDYKQAVYWYQKAADQGGELAQYNLAVMYGKGRGIELNYERAIYWFKMAAKQGNKNALAALAALGIL